MKVSDVMTPRVISIEADAPVMTAVRLMLQNRISGLPVVGAKGELVGMVTEGDFLRRGEIGTQRHRSHWLEFLVGSGGLASEYVHAFGRRVEEVMSAPAISVTEDTPLEQAVDLMERHRIKRLPVLHERRPVGIITRANLMHALVSLAIQPQAAPGDDASIRAGILAEFERQSWPPLANVVVHNGVVDLWGVILDERERQARIVAAENVPGVKGVHDHLVWIEPNSGFIFQSAEDEARGRALEGQPLSPEPAARAAQAEQAPESIEALINPG
jgi:CBS domain-containing protein